MINIENVITPSAEQWKSIILGARNAMNSWDRSDSKIRNAIMRSKELLPGVEETYYERCDPYISIGENDLGLMKKLTKAGTDHRKFMRMITVYLDITAPLYWWKEMDTYKVGTVANSCSTMHKIADKEFTLEDFSCEHLDDVTLDTLEYIITQLEYVRRLYLKTKDKKYWWQMIQLLPSSYNQRRTVMLNYEVLANIFKSRRNHKLDEWRELCKWIKGLPYSELITGVLDGTDSN